jgi:type II secretory pathway predicted ATPase ExeA
MYLDYWGLKRFPFDNVADPSFFYLSESHEEALSRLLYASKMRKGGAMLTGDIGCGKTLIGKVYMKKLMEGGSTVSLLTNPPLGQVEFLQEILYQLDVRDLPDSKTKLLQILNKKMIQNMEQNEETVIIIDEAQILNEETFEEARLLLNFQSNDRFLLTLVLIGQSELKVKIRQMKQFDQRIAIRYHLNPFPFLDTTKYIMFREKKAGFANNVFTTPAIKKIYEYSEGVPRRINSVCDLCLLIAFTKTRKFIDSGIIESVIDELE